MLLVRNSLTGAIPSELGLLSDLDYLVLRGNSDMIGTIPVEICNLKKDGLFIDISETNIDYSW